MAMKNVTGTSNISSESTGFKPSDNGSEHPANLAEMDTVKPNQKKRREKGFTYYCGDRKFIKTFFKLFLPSSGQALAAIFVIFINNFYLASFCTDGSLVKTGLGLADPVLSFTFIVLTAWLSGITVMLSQYFGSNEYHRTQQIIVYSFISASILMLPLLVLLAAIPKELITMTSGIPQNTNVADLRSAMDYGAIYMRMLTWTFIPLIFSEAISNALQITERAGISFIGSLIGVVISLVFDPIAIILTKTNPWLAIVLVAVIDGLARIAQLIFLLIYIAVKKYQPVYIFKNIRIEKEVWVKTLKYGFPSFMNDFLFACFATLQTIIILRYSHNTDMYGNIQPATTNVTLIMQFANVIWPGMAASTSLLVGSSLGEGKIAEAKLNAKRSLLWSFIVSVTLSLLIFGISWGINKALDADIDPVKVGMKNLDVNGLNWLSMKMEWVLMPIVLSQGIFSIFYYSVRTGGTKLVVLCDSVIMGIWTVIMAILTFTGKLSFMDPVAFIFLVQCEQILRMIASALVFKYSHWARNLTSVPKEKIDAPAVDVVY
ncbi:MATE family efflux transporter [Ureaplasma ceti]|uniref:Probable multidrug resistance protein NorM n=1 Tax=Ureaplasma ceti TaxID=3119530 RepID=A0ABP9U731_9BACT